MFYQVEFKPKSIKDCRKIPKDDLEKLFIKKEKPNDSSTPMLPAVKSDTESAV